MIAVDTSSMIAYLAGEEGSDVESLELALENKCVLLPPVVLSELLSDPRLSKEGAALFKKIPLLQIKKGFWERVGMSRAKILKRGLKARLADTLVAQCCIDHEMDLITRDVDFRHFKAYCGLKLAGQKMNYSSCD